MPCRSMLCSTCVCAHGVCGCMCAYFIRILGFAIVSLFDLAADSTLASFLLLASQECDIAGVCKTCCFYRCCTCSITLSSVLAEMIPFAYGFLISLVLPMLINCAMLFFIFRRETLHNPAFGKWSTIAGNALFTHSILRPFVPSGSKVTRHVMFW